MPLNLVCRLCKLKKPFKKIEPYLIVLVELTAKGHSQVACSSRNGISSKESFPIVVSAAPSLTEIHVLKA